VPIAATAAVKGFDPQPRSPAIYSLRNRPHGGACSGDGRYRRPVVHDRKRRRVCLLGCSGGPKDCTAYGIGRPPAEIKVHYTETTVKSINYSTTKPVLYNVI
jgi:hypothetical protein